MKSFEEWTQGLAQPPAPTWQKWEDEGYGLLMDGRFRITCKCCDGDFYISDYIGPEEFDPDVSETWCCGRSEWCCP